MEAFEKSLFSFGQADRDPQRSSARHKKLIESELSQLFFIGSPSKASQEKTPRP